MLGRKALLFWSPLQNWQWSWYRFHYAFCFLLPFAGIACCVEWQAGARVRLLLPVLPIAAVFLACLLTYAHDRYRYTVEPFVILLGARGLLITLAAVTKTARPARVARRS